jgi:hypothetical protein
VKWKRREETWEPYENVAVAEAVEKFLYLWTDGLLV